MTDAAGTAEDRRLAALRRSLAGHRPQRLARGAGLMEAAVALVLRPGDDLELLLIERTERSDDPWSGHMALPGGRRDPGDADLVTTAFRETEEEVGITLDPGRHLLGPLDEVRPGSRRLPPLVIAPFVAAVGRDVEVVPHPAEVATAMWVPLAALLSDDAAAEVEIEIGGTRVAFPAFRYRGYDIWGLTHRILSRFFELTAPRGVD
jgi:8-oxo-dGTP pyrophosphatase MutT (NUDIX family)